MIVPQRAIVRPHAVSPFSGQTLPLEELVLSIWGEHAAKTDRSCVIQITGHAGSGKTTALAHLAAVLPHEPQALFLDDTLPTRSAYKQPVIVAHRTADRVADAVLKLAAWTQDDLIEYLLAAHPQQCGSVLSRLRAAADDYLIAGNPELWRLALDELAADETIASVHDVLEWIAGGCFDTEQERRVAGYRCLAIATECDNVLPETAALAQHTLLTQLMPDPNDPRHRPLRHSGVQLLLAAGWAFESIMQKSGEEVLGRRLPHDLIQEAARYVAASPPAQALLRKILSKGKPIAHPMAASLLVAAGISWRPKSKKPVLLQGGYFSGVCWPGIELPSKAGETSNLSLADFSRADLTGANLNGVFAEGASFRNARLQGAKLELLKAPHADFSLADLSGANMECCILSRANLERAILAETRLVRAELISANLQGARFVGADLEGSNLTGAKIEEADFSGANFTGALLRRLPLRLADLRGAVFSSADMLGCDLEGVNLPDADFSNAILKRAWLTGSRMPRANFAGANLAEAGLADIEWEDANLRGADLRGCAFHLGSTRSGLVGSLYPCEGSKTGFYTDDFHDQGFKAPEEIRKANLCGADLRGAKLDGVDFYLVDLRGAKYDPQIVAHLGRCGAILFDRCPGWE